MKLLFRLLAWKLFGVASVALVDHDGAVNIRYVRGVPGLRLAHRHGGGIRTVRLLPNGKVREGSYVVEWLPFVGTPYFGGPA